MLETKFGLKYPMPHVLVHIVDNSSYTGELGVLVADDPSLYGTIVVTGTPMGEDRRMINVSRSDILSVAYGLGNLTTGDIQKYGQTITYPLSLIEQGAPVKLLRVTPDDACYAFSCITVEWRWIPDEQLMHVRYNTMTTDELQLTGILSNFNNKDRLNAAIVKNASGEVEPGPDDPYKSIKWKRRAFMVNISAGRGSAYNTYTTMINQTVQGKRPANVRYMFSTYDTINSSTVEQYYASLINENNGTRDDAIDGVNVTMKKRMEGSSVVVNYLNEAAVRELYADYRREYATLMNNPDENVVVTDYIREAFALVNINTFDPIFGLYIYGGTDEYNKLPFFQVDMRTADIQMLPVANRVYTTESGENAPELLASKLLPLTTGVARDGDQIYVGDVYLYAGTTSLTNPYLYIVTGINQFSGAVTTVRTNNLLVDSEQKKLTAVIETNTATGTDEAQFKYSLANKISKGTVKVGDVVAWHTLQDDAWTLKLVTNTDGTCSDVSTNNIYGLIDWANFGAAPYGNLVAVKYGKGYDGEGHDGKTDGAYSTIGGTFIDATIGEVYVNMYDFVADTNENRVEVFGKSLKYGQVPSTVSVTNDVIGTEFDVISVLNDGVTTYQVTPKNVSADLAETADANYLNTIGQNKKIVFDTKKYTLVTGENAPEGWETNYVNYYKVVGTKFVPVTGDSAPSWADNTYYTAVVVRTKLDGNANGTIVKLQNTTTTGTNDLGTIQTINDIVGEYVYTTYAPVEGYLNAGKFYEEATYTTEIPGNTGKVYFDLATGVYYKYASDTFTAITGYLRMVVQDGGSDAYDSATYPGGGAKPTGISFNFSADDFTMVVGPSNTPTAIHRYMVTGAIGSLYRVQQETTVLIPRDYYSESYGINLTSTEGGVKLHDGYTGFFDDNISDIEFKWRYSQLLVEAYRGRLDPRIMSPVRCPAKYLFDGGTNTIVGQTILPSVKYSPIDLINASTIFTADEKDVIVLNPDLVTWESADIDVKQAMYELMVYRCYYGMPEDKRPLGPGFGLSLHLDSGNSDSISTAAINNSFIKRFDNPNASWDIGGYVSAADGVAYTYVKRIADNLTAHCKTTTVNKPYTGNFSAINPDEYLSFFPDLDVTDWDYRAMLYNSGGNAWVPDVNGRLIRKSQRTLMRSSDTSDLLQESNMRTLSQLCYLLQNKLEEKLFEYTDNSVLKTMEDECNNMFSNWVGNLVESLEIRLQRDINPLDGGEIVVCYVNVTFRGITLRIPVIVNVNRRAV